MEKQKVKFTKILVYTLLITMIAIILIAQTYAKYTSSGAGSDNTKVAKWDIKLNGTTIESKTINFSLFDTIYDSDTTTEETDVEKKAGQKIIAPGTSGKFYVTVKNDSEVTAKYNMSYSVENTQNIPIEYSIDKTTWTANIAEINANTEQYITLPIGSEEKGQTIYWRWKYEGTDSQDTALGINGTASIKVTLKIIAEQVDKTGTTGGGTGGATTPYIPTGFSEVAGTSLASGYTIQDSKENQYVWVEVPQTEEVYTRAKLNVTAFTDDEYTAIENDLQDYTDTYGNGTIYKDKYYSDETTGLTSEQYYTLKKKMLKSVYQNGGFYVGKYETGIEAGPKTSGSADTAPTEIPVIKQNVYPYNYVTCSQAQKLASGMESGEYTTSLMFGVQWDLVLKYLETKGATPDELNSDSTSWGNYKTNPWNITNASLKYAVNGSNWTSGAYGEKADNISILLSTGASDTFSKQGIYDLAGNVMEYTLEWNTITDTDEPCVYRGSYFGDSGNVYPASDHDIGTTILLRTRWWLQNLTLLGRRPVS